MMKQLALNGLFKRKRIKQFIAQQYIEKIVFNLNFYSPNISYDFDANFNYLTGSDLIKIDSEDIPNLIKKGLITQVKQTVYPLDFEPELSKHGFECRFLPEEIQLLLNKYNKSNAEDQRKLREQIRGALEELLAKHFHLQAVALDAVYRNTSEDSKNTFKSLPLVHIDFPEKNPERTLESFKEEWGARVSKKLGSATMYDAKNIELMVNVWMPLDAITACPLVLCSNENLEPARVCEYDAVRRNGAEFKAISLTPPADSKPDPWFYRSGMKGQCYMFNSRKGIHTATNFPHETDHRESIEVRVALFK